MKRMNEREREPFKKTRQESFSKEFIWSCLFFFVSMLEKKLKMVDGWEYLGECVRTEIRTFSRHHIFLTHTYILKFM